MAFDIVNADSENPAPSDGSPPESPVPALATPADTRFFQRTDWLSFWVTTILVLAVYLRTLSPDVTLGISGIYSVGAMYAGVTAPPGYPIWTIYGWLFTKLLPFSNIAWRVAVSSAVAGALICGFIALLVSRGGGMMLEGIPNFRRLRLPEEKWLRVVCGCVAGMGLGFDGAFWGLAVIADPWPLSLLSLTVCLCLLFRWFYRPEHRRYLHAAFFVYGVTLTCSQALAPAMVALPFIVALADEKLGRDFFCVATAVWVGIGVESHLGHLPLLSQPASLDRPLWVLYFVSGTTTTALCAWLIVKTRSLFTEWKTIMLSIALFLLGLSAYFYLPLASMTNPPVNWGYPRTVEGFYHVLSRGQFERIHSTENFDVLLKQLLGFGEAAMHDFGSFYLIAATIPYCFLRRMRTQERRWMLGLLAVFLALSVLMLVLLNPSPDRQSLRLVRAYFTAAHLVLAVWAGYGLIILGTRFARERVGS